jgi:broad specificity phosphatase PhoE
MATLYLVRHGRAAAGWDTALDPSLDALGRDQAAATASKLAVRLQDARMSFFDVDVLTSPLARCRETAAEFERVTGVVARVEPRIAEIPSPRGVEMGDRVAWLRRAMQGTWSELIERDGDDYASFRDSLVGWARGIRRDTVAFSHFVAINVLIGAATHDDRVVIRAVDNASVTVIGVDAHGTLTLLEAGREADTLIR